MKRPLKPETAAKQAAIFAEAKEAARAAVLAESTARPEDPRAFDCGFAWVTISPARGAFVDWAREQKAKTDHHWDSQQYGSHRDYGGGGWAFWKPGGFNGQSIRIHEAGAIAFAAVLQKHGIPAHMGSRLD